MENRKEDIYGDNFLNNEYPPYWETTKLVSQNKLDAGAIVHGTSVAVCITLIALMLGFLWAQAAETVAVNYSFLVDVVLAAAVLFGAFKGSLRAGTMGLVHGALIGLSFSIVGILLLSVALPIDLGGAIETALIATGLGALGGVVGINYAVGQESKDVRRRINKRDADQFDEFDEFNEFSHRM